MGLLILVQVGLNLFFIAAITWMMVDRSKSKRQDDPRLARALQLITSKIAVLQDVMDRSETTGRQLSQLMDRKQIDLQEKFEEIEVYLHKLKESMDKSKQVASIFQDRIPHAEIIERQKTLKYLQAAKLSNQGVSSDEIARLVDLPKAEVELISRINKEKLLNQDPPTWYTAIESVASANPSSGFDVEMDKTNVAQVVFPRYGG